MRAGTTEYLAASLLRYLNVCDGWFDVSGWGKSFLEDAVTTATAAAKEQDNPDDGTASAVTAWVAKAETIAVATAAAQ